MIAPDLTSTHIVPPFGLMPTKGGCVGGAKGPEMEESDPGW